MLTQTRLRELLEAGHRTSDLDFAAHTVENMARTVYLMVQFLTASRYRFLSSVELQRRIDEHLRRSGVVPVQQHFNPVDWFSQQWTESLQGRATAHFSSDYPELFDRSGENPTNYRIKPSHFDDVVAILTDLDRDTEYLAIVEQLESAGTFDALDEADARVRVLRAIAVRQGQRQFRASLLHSYEGRCAITDCDAVPALEAAHIKPYLGAFTNVIRNGILLRADIHTLFDLELIAIEPTNRHVRLSRQLGSSMYAEYEGKQLRSPRDPSASPDVVALTWRWHRFRQ